MALNEFINFNYFNDMYLFDFNYFSHTNLYFEKSFMNNLQHYFIVISSHFTKLVINFLEKFLFLYKNFNLFLINLIKNYCHLAKVTNCN